MYPISLVTAVTHTAHIITNNYTNQQVSTTSKYKLSILNENTAI